MSKAMLRFLREPRTAQLASVREMATQDAASRIGYANPFHGVDSCLVVVYDEAYSVEVRRLGLTVWQDDEH